MGLAGVAGWDGGWEDSDIESTLIPYTAPFFFPARLAVALAVAVADGPRVASAGIAKRNQLIRQCTWQPTHA